MRAVHLLFSSVLLLTISSGLYAAAFGHPNGTGGTVYALGTDIINSTDANDFLRLSVPETMRSCYGHRFNCAASNQDLANQANTNQAYTYQKNADQAGTNKLASKLVSHSNLSPSFYSYSSTLSSTHPATSFPSYPPYTAVRRYYEIKQKKWLYSRFYIFSARYHSGATIEVQVSYDNGKRSWQDAYLVGLEYAKLMGYIPPKLRAATHSMTIHNHYNGLMGGSNNLIIFEQRGAEHIKKGSIEEALFHEATHNYFNEMLFKQQNPQYALWKQAQAKDSHHISYYAKTNDYEDMAESLLAYYAVAYKSERIGDLKQVILNSIPHRMAFFEQLDLNLSHE
ncbi:hypothetical protein [Psychrobacter lutiphocae]|uniref:hypothetical protein n=1 Tax=Psychrobacter lutiphocae TaxID=540500 RepID=UPI00037DF848|nr:hypothetical protein [Psychrobacter lutiphocae]